MLTFITTAKPFDDHFRVIQRNALKSWKLLHPSVEVILFGDESGAAEACADLGLRHEPEVERHESGMKYLDYMFAYAQEVGRYPYFCYANCDIVLLGDFWRAFEKAISWRQRFLLVGQRWDTDVNKSIDFELQGWERELRELALTSGVPQGPDLMDFFVFSRGIYNYVPPLVVGRRAWDAWLVWKAFSEGASVLDVTRFVVAVHQNHQYGYHPRGKLGTNADALARRNVRLCGEGKHLRTLDNATHRLTASGKIWRAGVVRFFEESVGAIVVRKAWQSALNRTFWLRRRVGLRRQTFRKLLGLEH